MEADTRMRTAARIGAKFQVDPMVVLEATPREWLMRLAAYNIVQEDDRKAAEQQRARTRHHRRG